MKPFPLRALKSWNDGRFRPHVAAFGSSPSGSTNTVQNTTPWAGQQPYIVGNNTPSWAPTGNGTSVDNQSGGPGVYNAAQALYTDNTPNYYPGDTYAPLTGQEQGLMSNLIGYTSGGGNSGLNAANENLTSTLSPGYTAETQGTFNQGNSTLGTELGSSYLGNNSGANDYLSNELSSSYLNPQNSTSYNTAIGNALAQAIPAASASFVNGNRSDSGLAQAAETSAATNAAAGLAQQQYDVNQGIQSQAEGQASGQTQQQYQANQNIQNQAATTASNNLLTQQANQGRDLLTAPMVDQQQLSDYTTGLNTAGMSQTDLQNQLNANVAQYNYGQMLPYNMLSMYANTINGTGSGDSSTNTSQPYFSNPLANVASGASAIGALGMGASTAAQMAGYSGLFLGAAPLFSDARLKTDIHRVGATDDGMGIYTFRYKHEPPMARHIGLIAQEVEKVRPEAVIHTPKGMMVDYFMALAA